MIRSGLFFSALLLFLTGVAASSPEREPVGMLKTAPALPPPSGDIVRVSTESELQVAVAAVRSGQTILIEPGEYRLSRTLYFEGVDNIALRGATGNRADVVLVGEGMNATEKIFGNVVQVAGCRGMLIADLTLTGAWYHNLHIAGTVGAVGTRVYNVHFIDGKEQLLKVNPGHEPTVFPDSGTVEYCRFEFTDRARQRYTCGIDILGASGWRVSDCEFIRIRGPEPDSLCDAAVMFWQHCRDLVVERCYFFECDFGIWIGLGEGWKYGKRDPGTAYDIIGAEVRNNIIFRRGPGDTGISLHNARDCTVSHNTVMLNGTYPATVEYRFEGTSVNILHNLTDGPITGRDGAAGVLDGNVTDAAASLFVDAGSGDLRLGDDGASALKRPAGQPCGVTDDFEGKPRAGRGCAPGAGR